MAGKSSGTGKKIIIIVAAVTVIVIAIFYALFGRGASTHEATSSEETVELNKVTEITTMNMDTGYPMDEREVVRTWGRIEQALYNEEYTDEQFDQMAEKLMALYDEELLAQQTDYIGSLRSEVDTKKSGGYTLQNVAVADKRNITYDTIDGRQCCMMDCLFSIRSGGSLTTTDYAFLLRKDDAGKWKILGFAPKATDGGNE